jgi:Protein of unknown function DUF45
MDLLAALATEREAAAKAAKESGLSSKAFGVFWLAHELMHLRVPNHGRLFKALMTVHVPNGGNSMSSAAKEHAQCLEDDSRKQNHKIVWRGN